MGGVVVGFMAPNLYLYQVAYDRAAQMQRALPDAIDLMTISVESGLGFDAAVQQVAANTDGPLADEFARVLREMQIGAGRSDALRAMGERSKIPELHTFVSAMVQADSFGIPIAQVLRVQSGEIRVKRRQRAEEKAQQVPVKITIPLIFCDPAVPVHRGHGTRRHQHHGQLRAVTPPPLRDPAYHRLADGCTAARAADRRAARSSVTSDAEAITAWLTAALIWLAAAIADRRAIPDRLVMLAESALIGLVAGLGMVDDPMLLAMLAVPPFIGGLRAGIRGLVLSLVASLTLLLTSVLVAHNEFTDALAADTVTWLMTGVGLGMIASFQHAQMAADDPLAPYRDAQRLLRGLLELSGDLGSGLDPIALGSQIAVEVRNELPLRRRGRARAARRRARPRWCRPRAPRRSTRRPSTRVVARAWASATPQVDGQVFAVPLRTDMGNVAVVAGILPAGTDPARLGPRKPAGGAAAATGRDRRPPRHRAAVPQAPRRRHDGGATPAGPRDARRRRAGHRIARLPRRRALGDADHRRPGRGAPQAPGADHGGRGRGAAIRRRRCAPTWLPARAWAPRSAGWRAT